MITEIITIGDEILIGQIVDTNSVFLAEILNKNGFNVRKISSISDKKSDITESLNNASEKSEIVIMTGGLGPTSDDITKAVLAEYFNTKLVRDEQVYADMRQFVEERGLTLNENNISQAEVPESCKIIRNGYGTASGMWFERNGTVFISMPGVPFEMTEMTEKKVIPMLKEKFKTAELYHKTVLTFGLPESYLAEIIADWEKNLPKNIKLAYLPSPERVRLRLSGFSTDSEIIIDKEIEKLKKIIGKAIFGYGNEFLENAISRILFDKKQTVTTAESCTGGNVAKLITSVSGSSEYFEGGVVAYSNRIKSKILGVKPETLSKFGAVSKETVEEMALGVKRLYNSDYSVAVSGIAGPGGAIPGNPVGTVWIAVASENLLIAKKFSFGQRRDINIRRASAKALDMLRKLILGYYVN